jgi:archaellum component FlaC
MSRMWGKALSERIERHIERGEHLMELNRAAFDRNTQAFERVMAALDRFEKSFDRFEKSLDRFDERLEENTIFIRDMNRRNEKVVQDLIQANAKFLAAQGKRTDEVLAEMRDVREESQAQRKALLALIDRLPPAAAA